MSNFDLGRQANKPKTEYHLNALLYLKCGIKNSESVGSVIINFPARFDTAKSVSPLSAMTNDGFLKFKDPSDSLASRDRPAFNNYVRALQPSPEHPHHFQALDPAFTDEILKTCDPTFNWTSIKSGDKYYLPAISQALAYRASGFRFNSEKHLEQTGSLLPIALGISKATCALPVLVDSGTVVCPEENVSALFSKDKLSSLDIQFGYPKPKNGNDSTAYTKSINGYQIGAYGLKLPGGHFLKLIHILNCMCLKADLDLLSQVPSLADSLNRGMRCGYALLQYVSQFATVDRELLLMSFLLKEANDPTFHEVAAMWKSVRDGTAQMDDVRFDLQPFGIMASTASLRDGVRIMAMFC
uniref:Non-structural RNA protein n=1 Tax=Piscine orthoreovirus TaxID=1157337 RepID=S5M2C4_9REOV|nr:non-structural RNA protein [Piscine orthoreovirus]